MRALNSFEIFKKSTDCGCSTPKASCSLMQIIASYAFFEVAHEVVETASNERSCFQENKKSTLEEHKLTRKCFLQCLNGSELEIN
uniref:Uncharacterized protein n=1 Tax=Ditylenchus dipsaci TaxID=166011 RepID=A0A915CU94_9BILA